MSITAEKFFSTDPRLLTTDVEDRFFTELKTRNNTFKRTASDRFRELDERCVDYFENTGTQLHEVLDIGVSSGSTTLALSDRLAKAGQTPRITGTDVAMTSYLVCVTAWFRVLVDEKGHPLQYELFGRAIRAWERRADYFTGMIILLRLLRAASSQAVRKALHGDRGTLRPLELLSPRLKARINISIEKNDIFQRTSAFEKRFDFIRAANILNHGYFEETILRTALRNVVRYMSGPGAWLLVARSSGTETASTLFRVSEDGRQLIVVERVCGGSEVERLVLATPLPRWSSAP